MAMKALFNQAPGAYAFGSLTGSYQLFQAVTPIHGSVTGDKGFVKIVYINNTLNQEVLISFDGGVTDFLWLPPNTNYVLDLAAAGVVLTESIYIKHNGVAPTAGKIYCNTVRAKA